MVTQRDHWSYSWGARNTAGGTLFTMGRDLLRVFEKTIVSKLGAGGQQQWGIDPRR
jgi:hypothetical protein